MEEGKRCNNGHSTDLALLQFFRSKDKKVVEGQQEEGGSEKPFVVNRRKGTSTTVPGIGTGAAFERLSSVPQTA